MPQYTVRLIMDCPGPNPQFNQKIPAGPNNPPEVIVPKGTVLTGPDAWHLCMPDAAFDVVRAEPADDVTKTRVDAAMDRRTRLLEERAKRKLEEAETKAAQSTAKKSRRTKSAPAAPPES